MQRKLKRGSHTNTNRGTIPIAAATNALSRAYQWTLISFSFCPGIFRGKIWVWCPGAALVSLITRPAYPQTSYTHVAKRLERNLHKIIRAVCAAATVLVDTPDYQACILLTGIFVFRAGVFISFNFACFGVAINTVSCDLESRTFVLFVDGLWLECLFLWL